MTFLAPVLFIKSLMGASLQYNRLVLGWLSLSVGRYDGLRGVGMTVFSINNLEFINAFVHSAEHVPFHLLDLVLIFLLFDNLGRSVF